MPGLFGLNLQTGEFPALLAIPRGYGIMSKELQEGVCRVSLMEQAPMAPERARLLNPLQLAHLGDAVWTLMIRTALMHRGLNVRHMHRENVASVNAAAQAEALNRVLPELNEAERDIALRGRNTHARHGTPHHQRPEDYQDATALEALMGYLYITGQEERLRRLFAISQEESDACPESSFTCP